MVYGVSSQYSPSILQVRAKESGPVRPVAAVKPVTAGRTDRVNFSAEGRRAAGLDAGGAQSAAGAYAHAARAAEGGTATSQDAAPRHLDVLV